MNGFDVFVLPTSESQCRPLSIYTGSELVRRWRAIVETIPAHKITDRGITAFLSDEEEIVEPKEEFLRLPKHLASHISRFAMALGMTTQNFVVMLLEQIFKPAKSKTNWRDFEQEDEWRSNLDSLREEGENFLNSG